MRKAVFFVSAASVLLLLGACGGESPAPNLPAPTTAPQTTRAAEADLDARAVPAPRMDEKLPPRRAFFDNPTRATPHVSPDGKWLAYLSEKNGVLNVYVAPIDKPEAGKAVTDDQKRGIRGFTWSVTSEHVLYGQDKDGDENSHVYATDVKAGTTKDLTPYEGVQALLFDTSRTTKDEILVGINDRDKQYHDLYRVNLRTAERKLVQKNEGFAGFTTAPDTFKVRFGQKPRPDGGTDVHELDAKGAWVLHGVIPMEDTITTFLHTVDSSGTQLIGMDSRGRDTAALVSIDIKTKKAKVLAEDPRADAGTMLTHPIDNHLQAVSFDYERPSWKVLDKAVQGDFDALAKVEKGSFNVLSRSDNDKIWTVEYNVSDGPVKFYRYDRPAKKATFLFSNRKALESIKLSTMHSRVVPARDGMSLVSYLTLPPGADADGDGKPEKALPMVLLVHGGPWGRDRYGYNAQHQWLASRGYAVLSVNFRGSTGFGKKFINAANYEWAAKMHDDLIDATAWAISQNIADPSKVAIMGGSYGGYATLVGLTFTPDTFACGVDIVGPSNLETLIASIPPYWAPMIEQLARRIGDHRTDAGKKMLAERSPLTRAHMIKKPLLIGQGKNDPRVKQAESDQIVKAMNEKRLPVTYVLFPDEGHGFARPENRLAFNAVTETFLAQCLGGSYEPAGKDMNGSTITVPNGVTNVFGLSDALAAKK